MFATGLITAGSLALGTGAFATAGQMGWIALPCTSQEACAPSYAPIPSWPVNDSGQISGVQDDSPVAPDLVRVMATNGNEGYAFSTELQGPQPTSLADATKKLLHPEAKPPGPGLSQRREDANRSLPSRVRGPGPPHGKVVSNGVSRALGTAQAVLQMLGRRPPTARPIRD